MTAGTNTTTKFIAVALLGLALSAMALVAAFPFVRANWLDEEIDQSRSELAALRKAIAHEGALRKENIVLAARSKGASQLLLQGETTGIAGANLQKLLGGLVSQHQGTASSIQILPPVEDGNLMRIPMSMSISVGIDGLRDIVHSLETRLPLIFIDDIAVRSPLYGADPHFLGPLDVTLQVSGFVLKNKAS